MKQALNRDEILYRANTENPPFLASGDASYALFIDADGCSVERNFGRSESEACDALISILNRYEKIFYSIHSITSGECLDLGALPHQKGKRECHAEIHESQDIKKINLITARKMAKKAKLITLYST